MKMNKKGFSLVEIIVAIAIMAVMTSILVPALMASRNDSNMKMDKSAIENFETSMVMAFQNNSIYKDARDIADETYGGIITVVCGVDSNNIFKIQKLEITHKKEGLIDDTDGTEAGQQLTALKEELEGFVNGNIEPITIKSEQYLTKLQYFDIRFPDVDFKIETNSLVGTEKDVADATTRVAEPGLYRGAYKQNGQWILPKSNGGSQLHLHTGYGGMASNQKGDVWKITLTGEQLQGLKFGLSYKNEKGQWVSGGSELLEVVKNGSSYEVYLKSTVDLPSIALTFRNSGDETAIIDNVQFVKVY